VDSDKKAEGRGHRAEGIPIWKHQIPSTKFQINPNNPNSKHIFFGHLKLKFGIYFGFACLPVGREFVIWDFLRYALSAMLFAIGNI
jgi:hypothetical protein